MKDKRNIKAIAFLFIITITFFPVCTTIKVECFDTNKAQAERSNLRKQNEKLRGQSEQAQEKLKGQELKKSELEEQISDTRTQIAEINDRISKLDKEIRIKSKEVTKKQNEIKRTGETLKKKVSALYKTGGEVSTLNMIFNCSDVKDFFSTMQLIEVMNNSTYNLIKRLDEQSAELKEEQQEIEKKRNIVLEEKSKAEEKKNEFKRLCDQVESIIQILAKEKSDAEKEIDINSAEIKAIDNQEAEYYRKQREEEARKNSNSDGGYGFATFRKGKYVWPAPTCNIVTSEFGVYEEIRNGRGHSGIDIAMNGNAFGQEIIAAASGNVIYAGWAGGYGNCTIIDHGGGYSTLYAHQSKISVKLRDSVSQGQIIGYIGDTGHSFGAHLHFETRRYNPSTGEMERYNPRSEF